MYDKQVRQQRGCHAEKRDKRKFNCGTSYRWVTITISENLCEACIIQENQISLTEEGVSDVSSFSRPLAENLFSAKEETQRNE